MEAQGGAESPGKSHFLLPSLPCAKTFVTLHKRGLLHSALLFEMSELRTEQVSFLKQGLYTFQMAGQRSSDRPVRREVPLCVNILLAQCPVVEGSSVESVFVFDALSCSAHGGATTQKMESSTQI